MKIILILFFYCVFNIHIHVQGFLLDDRTSPPTTVGPAISDYHYAALVNMLMSEREDRRKLEKQLSYLQKELVATQTGVTDLYHDRRNTTDTMNQNIKQMDEKYNKLQTKYDSLKADFDILYRDRVNNNATFNRQVSVVSDKYDNLQKKYFSLKADFDRLDQKCSENDNKTNHLEEEISSLKQLKSIGDIQTVIDINKETKHLEQELQSTNSNLKSVISEANARKQDVTALFTKADKTDKKLNSSLKELQQSAKSTERKLENYIDTKVSALAANQSDQLYKLETSQNKTKTDIQNVIHILKRELLTQPNRVAVTAGASSNIYSTGSIVMFPNIYATHGINSSSLSDLRTTGEFTCTRPGLYLISVFIMTPTHFSRAGVYKNNNIISFIYFSSNGYYQTKSVSVLENLAVKDRIYVKVLDNMQVYSDRQSCISLLQITE